MPEKNFEILHEHYNKISDLLKYEIKKRDNLFLLLIFSIGLFTVQISNAGFLDNIIINWGRFDKESLPKKSLLSSFMWIFSFIIFIKYSQSCYLIKLKYSYLKKIETILNSQYENSSAFTFEGEYYKDGKSFSRGIVKIIFKLIVPLLILGLLCTRIHFEYVRPELSGGYSILNIVIALAYAIYVMIFSIENR